MAVKHHTKEYFFDHKKFRAWYLKDMCSCSCYQFSMLFMNFKNWYIKFS